MLLSSMVLKCVHKSKIKIRTVKLLALLFFGWGGKVRGRLKEKQRGHEFFPKGRV